MSLASAELQDPAPARRPPARRRRPAPIVWQALWTSRLAVLVAGVLAVIAFGPRAGWQGFDPLHLTSPFGYFGNLLAAPFARWDSVWYLSVARNGYGHTPANTAFYPLYPLMIKLLGDVIGSDLIAGVLISLVAFAFALELVHRLVLLDLGDRALADLTVLLIAFSPMSYFFSAVYTEALYLALSVGCILQARRGRWAAAGVLGGLAAASRNSGVVLILPVAILFLYGPRTDRPLPSARWMRSPPRGWRRLLPRHPPTPAILWLTLIPVGLAAYIVYLAITTGDGFTPFHIESVWYRTYAGPFGGVWTGTVAAWDGLRQLIHGPPPPLYFDKAGGNPMVVAGQNLMLFGFLVLGAVATVGVFRTLPFAYGAYVVAALALPLTYPVTPQPLASLPRYQVVLFPLFMWAAVFVTRRRIQTAAIATLAVFLGVFAAEFATWRFVA
jgi:Mannosyltransferase (PIG-V)